MKHFETSILIEAPVTDVWNTLMKHEAYSEWNPFVKSIEGKAIKGEKIKVCLQMEGSKPMNISPTVLLNKKEQEFRWLGHMGTKGLFDGEHYFKIEAVSSNETRLVHGEVFSGILSGLILMLVGEKTLKGFKAMNEALKQRVEQSL